MTSVPLSLVNPREYGEYEATRLVEFFASLEEARGWMYTNVERVPLQTLTQWNSDPDSGVIRHASGKFFTIQGVEVHISKGPSSHQWSQPIILQPEIGILGILVKEFNKVPHYLMQLKAEPGNRNGIQLSPTVQATRSNYTRVHGGSAIPYLDYFRERDRHRVVSDVRQSEQGSWFLQKRNRNMVVEVSDDVEVLDGFHWLTIAQIHDLLRVDDLVNMDARSVLSCLPFLDVMPATVALDRGELVLSLIRSWSGDRRSLHSTPELLSWITDARTRTDIELREAPLNRLPRWHYGNDKISHETSRFFDVIGVRVEAAGREVGRWDQPMIAARDTGLAAFLVTRIDGVLHVLVGMRIEPGFADVAELAPTVQCTPANYELGDLDLERPAFLDEVLQADSSMVRFDTTHSEEGGRFFHTRSRYMIVETTERLDHPDFRWMTLHQVTELLRHSHYVNIQARSLLACMATLATSPKPISEAGMPDSEAGRVAT